MIHTGPLFRCDMGADAVPTGWLKTEQRDCQSPESEIIRIPRPLTVVESAINHRYNGTRCISNARTVLSALRNGLSWWSFRFAVEFGFNHDPGTTS